VKLEQDSDAGICSLWMTVAKSKDKNFNQPRLASMSPIDISSDESDELKSLDETPKPKKKTQGSESSTKYEAMPR
jgi:hypothetical protein